MLLHFHLMLDDFLCRYLLLVKTASFVVASPVFWIDCSSAIFSVVEFFSIYLYCLSVSRLTENMDTYSYWRTAIKDVTWIWSPSDELWLLTGVHRHRVYLWLTPIKGCYAVIKSSSDKLHLKTKVVELLIWRIYTKTTCEQAESLYSNLSTLIPISHKIYCLFTCVSTSDSYRYVRHTHMFCT